MNIERACFQLYIIAVRMLNIKLFNQALRGTVVLPLSKSIANRLLIMHGMSGSAHIPDYSNISNDVRLLFEAVDTDAGPVHFEDAGTPLRFYLAYAAFQGIDRVIDVGERLAQRPVKPLLEALSSLGADYEPLGTDSVFPLSFVSPVHRHRNEVKVDASLSSQFLSALMLIAPGFESGLRITNTGDDPSASYSEMTASLMRKAGIEVYREGKTWTVFNGDYQLEPLSPEADWSAAAYFYALAAVAPASVIELKGLQKESVQGDSILAQWYSVFGVETEYTNTGIILRNHGKGEELSEFDFKNNPDLFPSVIASLAALKKNAFIKGIKTLRYKESDRIEAMRSNLIQTGCRFVFINEDEMSLEYENEMEGPWKFEVFNDHRIAMACSLFALKNEIVVDDESVVRKSFPDYWTQYFNVLNPKNL